MDPSTQPPIVQISSVMGRTAGRMSPGYGPAKAALEVLVKSMAEEWGALGVRVNAVAPGRAFLLAPAAGYITGTTILVEGGSTSRDTTGLDSYS